ncbi:MAG TPA: DUF302 domain-containing protein [Terriglobales bacterium]|nr:DUF302 domain-containing protein [Terriglobales bacterium]
MTIITPPENVIAVQTAMSFEQTLESLRSELALREFRILLEVDFTKELDSRIGVSATRYVVLIAWHPFSAYQAILSDSNGGLVVPFNVAVYQNGGVTIVSVLVQPSLMSHASLGMRVLGQELNRKMRDVLLHLGKHERQTLENTNVVSMHR